MLSRAHTTMTRLHEGRAFTVGGLSTKLKVSPQSIKYILTGTIPKVTVAIQLEAELGIPVNDWTIPADTPAFAPVTFDVDVFAGK